jgi:hypothetical protein
MLLEIQSNFIDSRRREDIAECKKYSGEGRKVGRCEGRFVL